MWVNSRAGQAAKVALEGNQVLAIEKNELPHASPAGQTLLRLGGTGLRHAIIEFFEDVMLERSESFARNVAQLCLNGKRQGNNVAGRIPAPKGSVLPNFEEAVHLMDFGDEAVLYQMLAHCNLPRVWWTFTYLWETLAVFRVCE